MPIGNRVASRGQTQGSNGRLSQYCEHACKIKQDSQLRSNDNNLGYKLKNLKTNQTGQNRVITSYHI
jgi:hypothetical protein